MFKKPNMEPKPEHVPEPVVEKSEDDLDFNALREKAQQSDKPATVKKVRKPRAKKVEPEIQVSKTDLKPFFVVMNMVLGSAKITPLSKEEIEVGIESWFPIYQKYAKYLIGWSIWIPPLTWTTGIYLSRKPELEVRQLEAENANETEKIQENE